MAATVSVRLPDLVSQQNEEVMNASKSFVVALVAGLLAVGGLAACGSDDESSDDTATAATLDSDELVSQANAICKEHADAINSAVGDLGNNPSAVDVRVIVKETIWPQYSAQIGQLDQLTPPDDQADAWAQWLTDSTAVLDAVKEDPNNAFDPSLKEFAVANDGATSLGVDCQVGPTT
jgi:hypothetical protein